MDEIYQNNKKVTLQDIALKTGFTKNTVSRALRNKPEISEATRKLINDAAREMGYITNTIAGALRSGVTKTIAIILGDISNPHFGIMAKEVEIAARRHFYNTFIINTDENYEIEEKAVYSALSKKVDGIILCPTQRNTDDIQLLKKNGIPFVLWGRRFEEEPETDYVICNDLMGGYLATQHLIERGHRDILCLTGPSYISSARERLAGYQKALQESKINYNPILIREISVTAGECRQVVRKVLEEKIYFSAIFAFSDMIAWEAIYTLNQNSLNVPKDVAVVGFDNIQSRMFLPFPLTSISPSKKKMARRAVDVLLKKMHDPMTGQYFHEVIDPEIKVREST
ncbi:MAG TPA: LacI family transcriptional regulator [Firmicutes bacterium]|jgi:LacI family transcriptional regulator|nr:LacI family transcriptional regulator [Bacillota bacterium]